MKHDEREVIADAELVELFRRRRPDPEAFRARVSERIAEKGGPASGAGGAPTDRSRMRMEIARRAAAFLPIDPGTGSAFGKVFFTGLALPFLVLAACIGAFAAAGRSVMRTSSTAEPAASEPHLARDLGRSGSIRLKFSGVLVQCVQCVSMLILILPGMTASTWAVDLVVALVLMAAATLVFIVRALGDHALLTPRTVANYGIAILTSLLVGAFLWPMSRRIAGSGSDLGMGWSVGVLLIGVVAAILLARKQPSRTSVMQLGLVGLILIMNPLGCTRASPSSLRAQVASYDVVAHSLRAWEQLGLVTESLRASGESPPPSVEAERELDRALAMPDRGQLRPWTDGIDAHPRVWTAASQAGLMTHARWCALAELESEKRVLDQLLVGTGPLQHGSYHEYQFPMLLETRGVSAAQREALAERVEQSWPAAGSHDPLAQVLLLVRWMDHLELPQRAEAWRPRIQALVREHWIGSVQRIGYQERGGFSPDPRVFRTSMAGPTYSAVVLMARFGVPEGIDLRDVRDYLRSESAAYWLLFPEGSYLKGIERAALLRLEHQLELPRRSWIAMLLAERAFIACLALVGLCLMAIRMAPPIRRGADGTGRLALP